MTKTAKVNANKATIQILMSCSWIDVSQDTKKFFLPESAKWQERELC